MTPDDFVQQKPAQDAMTCPTCSHDEHVSERCTGAIVDMRSETVRCDCRTGFLPFQPPYTTDPSRLAKAENGWVYCEACDAPQPVAGHECAGERDAGEALESAAHNYGEASAKGPGPNLDDAKAELRKRALAFAARGGGR